MLSLRDGSEVYVIAEIGINHNGDIEQAKALVKGAVDAGANGVKIQVRCLEDLYTKAVLADSTKAEQGTQYLLDEIRKTILSKAEILELREYASQFPVDFFGTPFDMASARFLRDMDAPLFKIGSSDLTNLPLIAEVASYGKPIILSTGMATEEEIQTVVDFLVARDADVSVLHCNSTYPSAPGTLNLNYMKQLRELTGCPVGYSGHEQGYVPSLLSVALGATIVERHITADTMQPGPDHLASLDIAQFTEMVDAIRIAEQAMGEAKKVQNQGEQNNRLSLAKSLVAARPLEAGRRLTDGDLVARSPAKGVSPLQLNSFLGKVLLSPLAPDDYIYEEHVEAKSEGVQDSTAIGRSWGIVGRVGDFEDFLYMKPDLVEIHMTWRDLFNYKTPEKTYPHNLVVHAPEYFQDRLIDFTSDNAAEVENSIEMLRRTIEIARDLATRFNVTDPRGPRVILHPGGHFKQPTNSDKTSQYQRLIKNLQSINSDGVHLLVENMPPLPWYFGGQWHNTVFMNPAEIKDFAVQTGLDICYDISHAQLWCNHTGTSLKEFTSTVLDHVAYLHVADAAGDTEEGMQIGTGMVDFEQLFTMIQHVDIDFIPEIWQGHLYRGRGFATAMHKIRNVLRKVSGEGCSTKCQKPQLLKAA